MSGRLLKASEGARAVSQPLAITRVTPPPVPAPPPEDPELSRLRRELDMLSALKTRQAQEIDRLTAAAAKAFAEGEAAGRQAGLKAAEDAQAQRLAHLEEAARKALEIFSQELTSLERASAIVAREALAKMFGAETDRGALVAGLVKAQLESLDAQASVRIEVARADFPDADALDRLRAALGAAHLDIRTSDRLQPGDCRLKLALGGLEVGFDQQWDALSTLLAEMAAPGTGL